MRRAASVNGKPPDAPPACAPRWPVTRATCPFRTPSTHPVTLRDVLGPDRTVDCVSSPTQEPSVRSTDRPANLSDDADLNSDLASARPGESPESAPPSLVSRIVLGVFVAVPLLAVLLGIPIALAAGWVSVSAILTGVVMYLVSVHGVTIGYHRYFTHRGFKTSRAVKIVLALAGSLAVQGRLSDWVGDHRKHHQLSDRDGDPHSPWEFGPGTWGLVKGLVHAHVGWLFTYRGTDIEKYAPDMLADRDLRRISAAWPVVALVSLGLPALLGFAVDGVSGALQFFFWASVVRVALVHHMTWSVNSVCHVFGKRPFASRDRSANVAWLAPISGGESWHSYHHADPTSARHGVLPWQLDTSALVIAGLERLGWVWQVRWPSAERIERFRVQPDE